MAVNQPIVWTLLDEPSNDDIDLIRRRLQQFNAPFWEVTEKSQHAFRIDRGRDMIGGVAFSVYGDWAEIDYLWVDQPYRGQTLGTQLMARVEAFVSWQNCRTMTLKTFSFQAKPFYEKLGFTVVFERRNYPKTSTQYFMEKPVKEPVRRSSVEPV